MDTEKAAYTISELGDVCLTLFIVSCHISDATRSQSYTGSEHRTLQIHLCIAHVPQTFWFELHQEDADNNGAQTVGFSCVPQSL